MASTRSRDTLLAYCRNFPGNGLLELGVRPGEWRSARRPIRKIFFSNERVAIPLGRRLPPGAELPRLNCLEAPPKNAGGETLFADAESNLGSAPREERDKYFQTTLTYETASSPITRKK